MIENFTNRYPVTKTLRFSLIPVGKTKENFNKNLMLEKDKTRAENYEKVKGYIDRYHKSFIESVLKDFVVEGVDAYAELYYKKGKEKPELDKMEKLESSMREQITKAFTSNSLYKKLFGKEIIRELLPEFLTSEEEKKAIEGFYDFTTYFNGFYQNRANMYSKEAKSTAISYRCINDNLPKFLDNAKAFKKIKENLPTETMDELNDDIYSTFGVYVEDIFTLDFFTLTLAQSGIDRYNSIIGGYTCSDGTKIQGLNEYINLYNQQVAKKDKSLKLPLIKVLYKQILTDRDSVSFIPEKFKDDNAVLNAVKEYYNSVKDEIAELRTLFADFKSFDTDGIFVTSGLPITAISNTVFGFYGAVEQVWNEHYEKAHPTKKITETYLDKEKKVYKANKSFSVSELQSLGNEFSTDAKSVAYYFSDGVKNACDTITTNYEKAESLLSKTYALDKKLCADAASIELVKNLLDAIKDLERFIKPLLGSGKEENKNDLFYGEFTSKYEAIAEIDRLYDKVRNYVTQKPFSTDKIQLNFDNSKLLNGWVDSKTENSDNGTQYGGYLFRKINSIGEYDYFLGISKNVKLFRFDSTVDDNDKAEYERLDYYQPKEQTVYGSAYKGTQSYNDDKIKIIEIIKEIAENSADAMTFAGISEYCASSLCTAVGLIKLIKNNYSLFFDKLIIEKKFQQANSELIDTLKKTVAGMSRLQNTDYILQKNYTLFPDVMADITELVKYKSYNYFTVSNKEFNSAVSDESKPLFLFKISNKDLEYAEKHAQGLREKRGTENLHTMYFKAMMSGSQSVFDIGSGQIFFREASIRADKPTHPANQPIKNKNPENEKKESVFSYDLIKDRRYTANKFLLHLSMTANYNAPDNKYLNEDIRTAIAQGGVKHIIGIDRGERNLLYISVIDENGRIVEQKSLNEIVSDNGYKVNYHALLDRKEAERDNARKSWGTVENIKELKEGYMSQVIHEICRLIVKYDAIVVMEDLNSGFKNSRKKVEKQVYDKFEKMLIEKLNYLVDKQLDADAKGGLLHAYQLTNKTGDTQKGSQNGILFYIPAWLTSKIDPTTGFVDLLKPRYTSVASAQGFFGKFDNIVYNPSTDMFEFSFNYDNFPKCNADFKREWTICTNGERIKTFRNIEKNSQWDNETVILTEAFKKLFADYGIDINNNLKEQIFSQTQAKFYKELTYLFALTLQMRNSITGNVDVDYLISPVRNAEGKFYDSRDYARLENPTLPTDADANGAYNIARKGLWAVEQIRTADDISKVKLSVKNAEWLEFAQK